MDFLDSMDTMLMGRVTYEMFSAHWPNVTSGDDAPFADTLNALAKIVFSKTLDRAPWGQWGDATIVTGSAAKEVAKLRQQSGKGMVLWGSISVAQSLMNEGLIDEYQLIWLPQAPRQARYVLALQALAGLAALAPVFYFNL